MFKNPKGVYHILFIISLIVFVALKLPELSLPYYWDELGVYSRSSIYLAQHGLGLMPSNLPPELSRGHPLLFSFIYGVAFKLFGISVTIGHAVSLTVSVILLITLYHIICRVSTAFIALFSVALLMMQPVFFAQSVLVLPEIMLALFIVWALYAFYRKNLFAFALFASMAILVKETAIILPAVIVGYIIALKIFAGRQDVEVTPKSLLLIFAPWLVFGLFLIVQKMQNGWFFFPLHIDNVSLSTHDVYWQSYYLRKFLFFNQGRYWWVKVFLIAVVVLLLKTKWKPKPGWFFLSLVFIVGFFVFSSINFYMDRYMLSVLPLLCWLVIESLNLIWSNKVFVSAISGLLFIAAVHDMDTNKFNYDCDMSYKRMVAVEQQAADYVCDNLKGENRTAINFPMNFILSEDNTGFRVNCKIYGNDWGPDNPPRYIIYGSNSADFIYNDWEYNEETIFTNGFAWVKILKRKGE